MSDRELLELLQKNQSILSKSLEANTNSIFSIKLIIKDLQLIDKLNSKEVSNAIKNLEKLESFKDDLIQKEYKETSKFKFIIISTSISFITLLISYLLNK